MSAAEISRILGEIAQLRIQRLQNAHKQAVIDRQMLSRHLRLAHPCPVECMHVVNARACHRARKGGAK